MTWWITHLLCFLVVFQDGSASEVYNGRVTPVNNNRVQFASVNGNTVTIRGRFQCKKVARIIWEDAR